MDDNHNMYSVECYKDVRLNKGQGIFVEIKWEGYSDSDNTWEPIENLGNCGASFLKDLALNLRHSLRGKKFSNQLGKVKRIKTKLGQINQMIRALNEIHMLDDSDVSSLEDPEEAEKKSREIKEKRRLEAAEKERIRMEILAKRNGSMGNLLYDGTQQGKGGSNIKNNLQGIDQSINKVNHSNNDSSSHLNKSSNLGEKSTNQNDLKQLSNADNLTDNKPDDQYKIKKKNNVFNVSSSNHNVPNIPNNQIINGITTKQKDKNHINPKNLQQKTPELYSQPPPLLPPQFVTPSSVIAPQNKNNSVYTNNQAKKDVRIPPQQNKNPNSGGQNHKNIRKGRSPSPYRPHGKHKNRNSNKNKHGNKSNHRQSHSPKIRGYEIDETIPTHKAIVDISKNKGAAHKMKKTLSKYLKTNKYFLRNGEMMMVLKKNKVEKINGIMVTITKSKLIKLSQYAEFDFRDALKRYTEIQMDSLLKIQEQKLNQQKQFLLILNC